MQTQHRSVVIAPTWALEAVRQRAQEAHDARRKPAPVAAPALRGLDIEPCAFEAWLAAGGERRSQTRNRQDGQRGG